MKYCRLCYFLNYNLGHVVFANICLQIVPGLFSPRTMQVFIINSWVGDDHKKNNWVYYLEKKHFC